MAAIINSNDNEEEQFTIPEQIMEIKREVLLLGNLFEKNKDGKPKFFDSKKERSEGELHLKYNAPDHQRYGATKWKLFEKQRLVDSVYKGFPIQGLTGSYHNGIVNGKAESWVDLEDALSRLDSLQEYYNDGFKYAGKLFSELDRYQQKRFEQYTVNIDVMHTVTDEPISDEIITNVFDRLNSGKPLEDKDRFWSKKDSSPLVKAAIELMKEPYWNAKVMKTDKFGDKERSILPEVCGLVATIAFGLDYTSTAASRLFDVMQKPIPDGTKKRLQDFCAFYNRIIERTEGVQQTTKSQMGWHKISQRLGIIVHDYLDVSSPIKEKEDMWTEVMTINRTVDNFMNGAITIWNGLPKAAKQNNSEKKNYQIKINRVREFYNKETRDELCEREGITWE
jgi:hypothetical protein